MLYNIGTKKFVFGITIFLFSFSLVSLINIALAQQPDSLAFPNSFNNTIQSNNMTTASEDRETASNASVTHFDLASLYNKLEKSVVSIVDLLSASSISDTNSSDIGNSTDIFNNTGSQGTGFIYDTKGHIITSLGTVTHTNRQQVEFSDGTIYDAKVIGFDPQSDLAVLLVEDVPVDKLQPVEFLNNSSNILVGEQAATIGDQYDYKGLLTNGVISGIHQISSIESSPGDPDGSSYPIIDTIVSSVVTNPGSAGGPLFNMKGQVIGMNSAVASTSGEYAGISIAISSNTIQKEVPQIISTGTFKHPWIGFAGIDLTPEVKSAIGLNTTDTKGVLVVLVSEGSPAAFAGIVNGTSEKMVDMGDETVVNADSDIIIGIDSKPVNGFKDILNYIHDRAIGDTINLKVLRNGDIHSANVTLTERP
jgi:S1-C subfamily serine protease